MATRDRILSRSTPLTAVVRAAIGGDEQAFGALVRAHQDMAVAFATAWLRDRHLAEDAAQDAFVEAYRALHTLREPAAFGAWLRTIVAKHCDRVTRRRRLPTTPLDAATEVASDEPSPHDALETRERASAVRRALDVLTEAEREAVLLYYMGDHSCAEAAAFLGVTPNTVKTRLHAARTRLRIHMSDIERDLGAARPSHDDRFARRVNRMIQPEELKQRAPWMWSPGSGTDVWALFLACFDGDLATVRRLVDADPSLVRSHLHYFTPLSFAVRENRVDVADFLLARGADPIEYDDYLQVARERGYTEMAAMLERRYAAFGSTTIGEPVAAAIRARDIDEVKRLLDADPSLVHATDARTNQPIHWAAMTRNLAMIDELLARGADIEAKRGDNARPIHLTNGDYHYRGWRDVPDDVKTAPDDVYRHLVARGAHVDLGMAAAKADMPRVRALLDADPSSANRVAEYTTYYVGSGAPLKNAVIGGDIEIVKLLLHHGADPNLPEEGIAPRGHALYSAVWPRRYDIARLLLEHGAYPNPPVESSADAVWVAIRQGDMRMLELLASYGATWEIPADLEGGLTYERIVATGVGRTLKILAYYGDVAAIESLLARDPELADDPEALGAAAGQGHEAIVRLLLHHRPDLASRVTVSRPRAMAELLFAHGMDPSRPSWMRVTPLHDFAGRGDAESAALFIAHGADLDARDERYRSTPLAWAAREGHTQMVELLLRHGAKQNLPDDPPWATPLAWATRRGHTAIVELLTDHARSGAAPSHPLSFYESIARDLVESYHHADGPALERIMDTFQSRRALTWDRPPVAERTRRLRGFVRERLGQQREPAPDTLALDDARLLIARAHGFDDWAALVRATTG